MDTATSTNSGMRAFHHAHSGRRNSQLSSSGPRSRLGGRRGAGSTGAAGSLDERSWLEYEGLTGLSGLGEAPEPDSDGCMCIDST
eukprot:scaffold51150_cov82-Phaeocystis_antarctica.AAC.1